MKKLDCKDLGDGKEGGGCHYVAEGMTDEEVMGKMKKHMMESHKKDMDEMMETMSEAEMMDMMRSKIKEA